VYFCDNSHRQEARQVDESSCFPLLSHCTTILVRTLTHAKSVHVDGSYTTVSGCE
jgi:hypothetical protein